MIVTIHPRKDIKAVNKIRATYNSSIKATGISEILKGIVKMSKGNVRMYVGFIKMYVGIERMYLGILKMYTGIAEISTGISKKPTGKIKISTRISIKPTRKMEKPVRSGGYFSGVLGVFLKILPQSTSKILNPGVNSIKLIY